MRAQTSGERMTGVVRMLNPTRAMAALETPRGFVVFEVLGPLELAFAT